MRLRTFVLGTVLLGGCGGKIQDLPTADGGTDQDVGTTDSDTGLLPDTALEADVPLPDSPPADPCKLSDGTPVCGTAGCPDPHPGGCTGGQVNCMPFKDAAGGLSSFGVCIQDVAKVGKSYHICTVCDEGQLCASMSAYPSPVCVQAALCDRLAQSGMSTACWWSDKTTWAPGQTIPTASCPVTAGGLGICGEACPTCGDGLFCTGRSPTHPLGVCAGVYSQACNGPGGATCAASEACFSFKSDSASNQDISNHYGFCMPTVRCKGLRGTLPGGAFCKDTSGAEIP
jgi:hypothetical protein